MAVCCLYGAFVVSIFIHRYNQVASIDIGSYALVRDKGTETLSDQKVKTLSFAVEGISCASCTVSIEDRLRDLDGIRIARLDAITGLADIVYDSRCLRPAAIISAVESLGFPCRTANIDGNDKVTGWDWGLAFSWSLLLVGPILLLNQWDWAPLLTPRTRHQCILVLAGIVQAFFGWPFYRATSHALRQRGWCQLPMDVLIAFSTTATYITGLYNYSHGHGLQGNYAATSALLIAAVSLNKHLESRFRRSITAALVAFAQLLPAQAYSFARGHPVPVHSLQEGNIVAVHHGNRLPCDGYLVAPPNSADQTPLLVDERLHTGEPRHVQKRIGDLCLAGTINEGNRTILLKVLHGGGRSRLGEIIDAILHAQRKKSRLQGSAECLSRVLVPSTIFLSMLTFIYWIPAGLMTALEYMTALLVVTCPCAIGLSVPAAVMIACAFSATRGIVFKNGAPTMQSMALLSAVVFDKTGTLTVGDMSVRKTKVCGPIRAEKWWHLIAAAEEKAPSHWAREVLLDFYRNTNNSLPIDSVHEFQTIPGQGIHAVVGSHSISIGNLALLEAAGLRNLGSTLDEDLKDIESVDLSIFVAIDNQYSGYIAVQDAVRKDAPKVISSLQSLGIKSYLMTGDRETVGMHVAQKVGIPRYWCGLSPMDKVHRVKDLQTNGATIAMVGDGINDAAALAAADIGISLQSGTSVALEASDIVLLNSSLSDIMTIIAISKYTAATIRGNVAWAYLYNAILMPLAMGVGTPWGIRITPNLAGFLMMGSSLGVMLNSMRLKNKLGKL